MQKSNVFDFFGWGHAVFGIELLLVSVVLTNPIHAKNCMVYGALSLFTGVILLFIKKITNK